MENGFHDDNDRIVHSMRRLQYVAIHDGTHPLNYLRLSFRGKLHKHMSQCRAPSKLGFQVLMRVDTKEFPIEDTKQRSGERHDWVVELLKNITVNIDL